MGLSSKPEPLKCPRCESTNTKFCYYNNYNKTQPRHFCKGCKRHWTEGGILRNVPVGGGRKNKRFKSDTSSTSIPGEKSVSQMVVQSKQNFQNINPLFSSATIDEEKYLASDNIFYKKLNFPSSSLPYDTIDNNNTSKFTGHVPQDENMLVFSFPGSTIGSFEKTIPNFIPTFTQSSNVHKYMEESTITTVTPMTCSSLVSQPWQRPGTSNIVTDSSMPNYWNWNDIDAFVSADPDILLDGDHSAEIKP